MIKQQNQSYTPNLRKNAKNSQNIKPQSVENKFKN